MPTPSNEPKYKIEQPEITDLTGQGETFLILEARKQMPTEVSNNIDPYEKTTDFPFRKE